MSKPRFTVAMVTSIALALSPCLSFADPGNGNGKGPGPGNDKPPHAQGHDNHGGGKKGPDRNEHRAGPSIDRNNVLGVVRDHHDYWRPGPALPPGVQKNLARGKPLPPGIAKKLDGRLIGHLPHYQGYEWMQVGVDLVLVAVATGIVYEVLNGALN